MTKAPKQPTYEETVTMIASNIAELAKAVESLLRGPLKRRALVVLLASSSRLSQQHVEAVLNALETLNKDWLNQR
jgi:hypothetical protein